jgi:hypothetical protein
MAHIKNKTSMNGVSSPNQPWQLQLETAMKEWCIQNDVHIAQFIRAAVSDRLQKLGVEIPK